MCSCVCTHVWVVSVSQLQQSVEEKAVAEDLQHCNNMSYFRNNKRWYNECLGSVQLPCLGPFSHIFLFSPVFSASLLRSVSAQLLLANSPPAKHKNTSVWEPQCGTFLRCWEEITTWMKNPIFFPTQTIWPLHWISVWTSLTGVVLNKIPDSIYVKYLHKWLFHFRFYRNSNVDILFSNIWFSTSAKFTGWQRRAQTTAERHAEVAEYERLFLRSSAICQRFFGGRTVMIMGSPDRSDSQFSCNIPPEVLIQMCRKGLFLLSSKFQALFFFFLTSWTVRRWRKPKAGSCRQGIISRKQGGGSRSSTVMCTARGSACMFYCRLNGDGGT